MADFRQELAAHLSTFRAAPFLFVGSGISRRYLGLDDWTALLRRLAALTGQPYEYYSASANGDLPTIASLIAEALHEPWWHEERFSDARDHYEGSALTRETALKVEASRYFTESLANMPKNGALAKELALLRSYVRGRPERRRERHAPIRVSRHEDSLART